MSEERAKLLLSKIDDRCLTRNEREELEALLLSNIESRQAPPSLGPTAEEKQVVELLHTLLCRRLHHETNDFCTFLEETNLEGSWDLPAHQVWLGASRVYASVLHTTLLELLPAIREIFKINFPALLELGDRRYSGISLLYEVVASYMGDGASRFPRP